MSDPAHRPATPAEIAAAARWVRDEFPVADYIDSWSLIYTYPWMAKLLSRHVAPGARRLDFGFGPGDVSAFLSKIGYRCTAADDLQDPWHLKDDNTTKILDFNRRAGVEFRVLKQDDAWPWPEPAFDLMLAHHVFEHIQNSPRPLLNLLIGAVKPGGLLVICVPNAANLRKRIALLRGRTNYPPYVHFFWNEGTWRGHVREYVRSDLEEMARFSGLQQVELGTYDYLAGSVSGLKRKLWNVATTFVPSGRDSWYLVMRKPEGWQAPTTLDPADPAAARLARIFH